MTTYKQRKCLLLTVAIPRTDGTCALGGSAWPGGSPNLTNSGRHLVIWLGNYTFLDSRIGRSGRKMNAAASSLALYVMRHPIEHFKHIKAYMTLA
jgi:hypothetical protein